MEWSLFLTGCQAEKGEREEQLQQNVEGAKSICRGSREARGRSLGGLRLLLSLSFLWRQDTIELSLVIFLPKVPGAGASRGRKGYKKLRISYLFLGSLTVLKVIEVTLDSTQSLAGCDLGVLLTTYEPRRRGVGLLLRGGPLDGLVLTLASQINE